MRIAVIQHRLRETPEHDARGLAAAAAEAAGRGAELVVFPAVPSLQSDATASDLLEQLLCDVAAHCLIPRPRGEVRGVALLTSLPAESGLESELGELALLIGDACFDPAELARVAALGPSLAVLVPLSESDLQAEAVLELAIGLSDSLAGLVLIAECAGADPGVPGHGGSAIVALGDVVAEAMTDDDVLLADVATPVPQPEPREPLPQVAPILVQRVAFHEGRKPDPPGGYPADLS